MIKFFNSTETSFTSNGNGTVKPIKCIETRKKSLNGWYVTVELGAEHNDLVQKDAIILVKVKSKLNPQAFRISEDIERNARKVSFVAHHVVFDSTRYFVESLELSGVSGTNALIEILSATLPSSNFSYQSDVVSTFDISFENQTLLEVLSSLENEVGGVFDADNFTIKYLSSIGLDRGETIRYGKNLQGIRAFEDWESVVTRIYPTIQMDTGLPEKYLDSVVQYDLKYIQRVNFSSDLATEDQTEANLITELRAKATEYLITSQYPKVSYEVVSDINQDLEIGDVVHVRHPLVNLETTVEEFDYNCLTQRVIKLVFGNYVRDVKSAFTPIQTQIKENGEILSRQQALISAQTNTINNLNKNGYVYITDNEIMIGDEMPIASAVNVWRWGLGGLGFSPNGKDGPFTTAITYDGKINADFILSGTVATDRINGTDLDISANESITSKVSKDGIISEINQSEEEISILAEKITLEGLITANSYFKILTDGSMEAKSGKIGSWTINNDRLTAGSSNSYVGISPGVLAGTKYYAFWAGNSSPSSAPFSVTRDGELKALSGTVGSWNLETDRLYAGASTTYVGISPGLLSSSKYYSFWAGNPIPSSAPFSVTRDGYLYAKSGQIAGLNIYFSSLSNTYLDLDGSSIPRLRLKDGEFAGYTDEIRLHYAHLTASTPYYSLGTSNYRWAGLWTAGGYYTFSDARLKENVQPINKASEFIYAIKPVQFKMIDGERTHYGLIAQEVKQVLDDKEIGDVGLFVDPIVKPDWDINDPIENDKPHYLSIRYDEFIAPLISTVQELNNRLKALEEQHG